jgi:transglutaminase-like putative cysteine protease
VYDFLVASRHVTFDREVEQLARRWMDPHLGFVEAVLAANSGIFREFTYKPGATTISTPLPDVVRQRAGVCQDFAHLLIAVLRVAGVPARYVSGYIETEAQAEAARSERLPGEPDDTSPLIGATASHGWVEFYTPNRCWVGLDPTNNQIEGERHIQIGVGRDYSDVPPLKGSFHGPQKQQLNVKVMVARTPTSENGENACQ